MSKHPCLVFGSLLAISIPSGASGAGEWDVSGYLEPELTYFFETPSDADQKDWNASLAAEISFEYVVDRNQNFVFTPFARIDWRDENRSHFDIRELRWERAFEAVEVRVGIDKVYWGVTEFVHLVDVINQTDQIESIDGEEKLGQPMVNIAFPTDYGTFEAFYLPYFRERAFETSQGRPRLDFVIDGDKASYEHADEEWHTDFAFRWSHYFGDWDIGLSHFDGTARAPQIRAHMVIADLGFGPMPYPAYFYPHYAQMKQTSLDIQATKESWLYKFEGLVREEGGDRYAQATGGIEYSFYGIFETAADLGVVIEYAWDERGLTAPTPFQNDVVAGLRLALNDEQSSTMLLGLAKDLDRSGYIVSLEAQRRLGSNYFLSIEARIMNSVEVVDPLYSYSDDDFLQIRLARHF